MSAIIKNKTNANYYSSDYNSDYDIGIVVSDYYSEITHQLLDGAIKALTKYEVQKQNIHILHVPGAFELIAGCSKMFALDEEFEMDGIIALGCVIKGDTDHDQYINQAVTNSIAQMITDYDTPISYGLLTTNTYEQAVDRSGGKHGNKGEEAALALLSILNVEIETAK